MAKIVLSELAPKEKVTYAFSSSSFELGSGDSYETDDPAVLLDAGAHPWLKVEVDPGVEFGGKFRDPKVDPKDDVLVAANSKAFKPVEEAVEEDVQPTAIDAGLNQTKAIEEGDVALTLAADDNEADAPKRKSAAKEKN